MGLVDKIKKMYKNLAETEVEISFANRRMVAAVVIFASFFAVILTSLIPQRVELQVGDVAPYDIKAPQTVINRPATEALKEERAAQVPMVYDLDLGLLESSENEIKEIFDFVRDLQEDEALDDEQKAALLREKVPFETEEEVLLAVVQAQSEELVQMEERILTAIRAKMQAGVKEEEMEEAREEVAAFVEGADMSSSHEVFARAAALTYLAPNMLFNEEETNRRIEEEKQRVEEDPIMILQGQVIVRSGEVVTQEDIEILEDIGLLRPGLDIGRMMGLALFVALLLGIVGVYMYQYLPNMFYRSNDIILLGVIGVITLLISRVLGSISGYLVPVAGGAMLVAILLDTKLAMVFTVVVSVMTGVVLGNDLRFAVMAMVGGFAGVFSLTRISQRSDMTRAGLLVSAANVAAIFAASATAGLSMTEVLAESNWGTMGIVSGLISAVLAIGALPYLENAFGITTPLRLTEIANPNHPLLRRLLVEAPGTYHHSIMVGNLAEAGAEAIGAEPLLARVGAYFHDIGKVKRPHFFIENQMSGSNPHDKVTPSLSSMIITSHIKDGAELAKEHGLPPEVIDIIQQHHGTSLVSYFYHLAYDKIKEHEMEEEDFRYEGPLPQSKEAALVFLADSVEAAVRAYPDGNREKVEEIVRKIIRARFNDGQLDKCQLTLKDLDIIGSVFIRILQGVYHTRIEYPQSWAETEKGSEDEDGDIHQ